MSAPVSDEQMFKPFELINEIFEAKSNEASTVAPHDEWKIPELYHAWLQGKDNFDDVSEHGHAKSIATILIA